MTGHALDELVEERDHLGAGAFPGGSLTTVPAGRTFLPLDHPGEVADEIVAAITVG